VLGDELGLSAQELAELVADGVIAATASREATT
jgi:hypothetical protein